MEWDLELGRQMCQLVRYRLEHPDYLHRPDYEKQLLQVFQDCQTQRPIGYAAICPGCWSGTLQTGNIARRTSCCGIFQSS